MKLQIELKEYLKLKRRYKRQLLHGCNKARCENAFCLSSGRQVGYYAKLCSKDKKNHPI